MMASPDLSGVLTRIQRIVTVASKTQSPLTEHEALEQIIEELELSGLGDPDMRAEQQSGAAKPASGDPPNVACGWFADLGHRGSLGDRTESPMRPFLVCHEYGTGGLWWWITANSAEEITTTYREVTVHDQAPPWWTEDIDREVPRRAISDEPDSALARLLRNVR